MSIAASNWAWAQQAPTSTAKLVLMAIADHANGEGECWPSMALVAELAQCSTRQVSRCVEALEDAGLLTRKRRRMHGGKLGSYVYQLPIATTRHARPVDTDVQSSSTSSGHARPVDTDDSTTGHTGHSPPDTGVRTEPSVEPPKNRKRAKRSPETPLPDGWQPNDGHHDLARSLAVDLRLEVDQFRDHAAANDRRQRDWDAAFRTWLRNAAKWNRSKPSNHTPSASGLVR